MKEDETRKLIKGSIVKTSDEFTEKLMAKVELQKARKTTFHFYVAFIACIMLFLFLTKFAPSASIYQFQFKLPSRIVQIIGSLFVFIMINRLIILKNAFTKVGQNLFIKE